MNSRASHSSTRHLKLALATCAALCVVASGSAAIMKKKGSNFPDLYQSGNLPAALTTVNKEATENAAKKDAVLWFLEQGSTHRTAAQAEPGMVPALAAVEGEPVTDASTGYIKSSLKALDQAEEKVNAFEEQAKVKMGSEAAAALTNLSALPYRGHSYDKVLMNAYKALNYMQLGQKDNARVELNRSLQRQRDAVAQHEKQIKESQETAEKAKRGEVKDEEGKSAAYDSDKAKQDPKTGPALDGILQESTANLVSYGDYVNPFTVFLDGLFFTVDGEGGSDLERGRKSMERVALMVPENPYVKADLALATAAAEGKAPEGITYIFFETGTGPDRDEKRIDIPTFLLTSKVAYVGAAFPKLVFNPDFVGALAIKAGDQSLTTATLCSMDSVVANDFKNEWPIVVSKTMINTATKAIVQAQVQKGANKMGLMAGLATKVGSVALNASTTHADTRTWSSIPKEFQYARLATPADRQLVLAAGGQSKTITLVPGAINIVCVKSITASSPLFVTQFALK